MAAPIGGGRAPDLPIYRGYIDQPKPNKKRLHLDSDRLREIDFAVKNEVSVFSRLKFVKIRVRQSNGTTTETYLSVSSVANKLGISQIKARKLINEKGGLDDYIESLNQRHRVLQDQRVLNADDADPIHDPDFYDEGPDDDSSISKIMPR